LLIVGARRGGAPCLAALSPLQACGAGRLFLYASKKAAEER
jgi:hypothetical protein